MERCFQGLNAELYNIYGPAETSIAVTAWKCRRHEKCDTVPIGRPISNARVYILDGRRQPVPVGVPGELYIGGVPVGREYLHRPELTAERFVPDPFSGVAGSRLYKTGDRCRYLSDGNIVFLERYDNQVKISGVRIELGEIEAALSRHPAVAQAAVVAQSAGGGRKFLAAYVVPRNGRPRDEEARAQRASELRQFLRTSLSESMIPQVFAFLDSLPQLPNGKVNRRLLLTVESAAPAPQRYVTPRTPVEERLAAIWAEVLGAERVGVHDNFFEPRRPFLTGRADCLPRAERVFGRSAAGRAVRCATLADLAERIGALQAAGRLGELPPISPVSRDAPLPMSYGQEALWVINQIEEGPSAYAMFPAARVRGPLNVPALERALNEVVRRHEVLRTTFTQIEGRPVQVIAQYAPQPLSVIDLSGLAAADREAAVERYIVAESQRPTDLAKGPLARVELLKLAEEDHVVLVGMHHIIYDGWSMAVLWQELLTAYRAFAAGLPSAPLAELPIQYADFAVWQRERLQGEVFDSLRGYWLKQLEGLPTLELPTDRPRPPTQTGSGGACQRPLPHELSQAIARLSRNEQATTFMTLVAAFETLLHHYSGQDDFPIGTPVAGRMRPETEDLIGYFVNTLVLRADVSGDPSFRQMLGRVRQTALQAFDHQEMPFERLVDELKPPRDLSRHPVFQVMFVLQNTPEQSQELGDLEISGLEPAALGGRAAEFDLLLSADEHEQGIQLTLDYRTDLFNESTAARMLEHFQTSLEAAVADPDRRVSGLVPQLPDGTIIRQRIPVIERTAPLPQRHTAPRTPLEERLAAIWTELLGVEHVGVYDNFFELGGHSLLAVRAMTKTRDALTTNLPVAAMFASPTIAELAEQINPRRRWQNRGALGRHFRGA